MANAQRPRLIRCCLPGFFSVGRWVSLNRCCGLWCIRKLVTRPQYETDIARNLIDFDLPCGTCEHLQGVAQAHGAELVLRGRKGAREQDVYVIRGRWAQGIARAADNILHRILDGRVHVGRNADIDDLGHQVALFGFWSGIHQGVSSVANRGLLPGLRAI